METISHECSRIIELIKRVEEKKTIKREAFQAFFRFFPQRFSNYGYQTNTKEHRIRF